ncbi:uncharacterized protein G2W53_006104 [Senna tora]|uniref:Uncharacterized protein n=1 Tax=Senna tora TaxID=362788 RepID=A0A834X3E6_9FABA|nr:uncharacterized protein G2W53_006099 [Senna tora]KAF7837622.1 uncharacterized protein G2W53_006104 [Senna tora]
MWRDPIGVEAKQVDEEVVLGREFSAGKLHEGFFGDVSVLGSLEIIV